MKIIKKRWRREQHFGLQINKINDNFKDVIANLLKQQDSSLIFQGFAKPSDDTPAATANHAYYVIERELCLAWKRMKGKVLVGDGNGFEVQSLEEKVGHDEIAQLAGDVEQLAYVKIKNEAVNGNFENGLIAPFRKDDGWRRINSCYK